MTMIPFVCLGFGIMLGVLIKSNKFIKIANQVSTIALVFLMFSIGLGIGLNEAVINNLGRIGFNCAFISSSAIFFSVMFTYLCEKTVLPLKEIDCDLQKKNLDLYSADIGNEVIKDSHRDNDGKNLVWVMPSGLILGVVLGVFIRGFIDLSVIDIAFIFSLIILYICVGISQGANREVFHYVRVLGFRILWLSVAIIVGSLTGGLLSGLILQIPLTISVIASGGMSFYSITGAFMTSMYGIEIGTYGFVVNVMREFFTIILMPLLIKISPGSPIAGGAAGNMDTMLAPITKFVGVRLGLVTLITGIILTVVVPFLLPLLSALLG